LIEPSARQVKFCGTVGLKTTRARLLELKCSGCDEVCCTSVAVPHLRNVCKNRKVLLYPLVLGVWGFGEVYLERSLPRLHRKRIKG
jgi:hypothetical protein